MNPPVSVGVSPKGSTEKRGDGEWCEHGHRQDANYWHAWQEGRAYARQREFYGVPFWLHRPWVRGALYAHVVAAPLVLIAWGLS